MVLISRNHYGDDNFLSSLMILMQRCWIAAVEVQMLKVPLKVFSREFSRTLRKLSFSLQLMLTILMMIAINCNCGFGVDSDEVVNNNGDALSLIGVGAKSTPFNQKKTPTNLSSKPPI